jgi:hypothetical protein
VKSSIRVLSDAEIAASSSSSSSTSTSTWDQSDKMSAPAYEATLTIEKVTPGKLSLLRIKIVYHFQFVQFIVF